MRPDASERTCLVTREAQPPSGLIRFVRAPDGAVVPDLKEKLPGRGVWVTGRRDVLEQAVRKRLFARGFKDEAMADPALPDLVDRLLLDQALAALSMARKAGRVVTGFGKVTTALAKGQAVAVLHAAEAAEDGRRKVLQAMMRRARLVAEADTDDMEYDPDEEVDPDEDPSDDGPEGGGAPLPEIDAASLPLVVGGLFSVADLDLALGGTHVIHAALLAGGASTSFLKSAAALARYRGGSPETDWMAGPRGPRHDRSFA